MRYIIVDDRDFSNPQPLTEKEAMALFEYIFNCGVDLGNWQLDEWGAKRKMPSTFDEIKKSL